MQQRAATYSMRKSMLDQPSSSSVAKLPQLQKWGASDDWRLSAFGYQQTKAKVAARMRRGSGVRWR